MDQLTDIWQEHKARLRAFVARRVPDDDAVDDILQEVLIKAYRNVHTLRARGSVRAWLFRIAANAIADYYRSRKPWTTLDREVPSPEPEPDPAGELADCLAPMIDSLPETYRSALVRSEIEGLPQKEVARQLGLSLSGAKSRIQRGRQKLRERLQECCVIETGRRGIVGYEPRNGTGSQRCT